jgi:UDP-N-acetylbacillosamine transaminase
MNQFDIWNSQKKQLDSSEFKPYFREGEVRWLYLGKNIGTEAIGKGNGFARPVLILKKVFGNAAIVIPLSSKEKHGSYYFTFKTRKNTQHTALLTQVRYIDSKRLLEKISTIKSEDFKLLKLKYLELIN